MEGYLGLARVALAAHLTNYLALMNTRTIWVIYVTSRALALRFRKYSELENAAYFPPLPICQDEPPVMGCGSDDHSKVCTSRAVA